MQSARNLGRATGEPRGAPTEIPLSGHTRGVLRSAIVFARIVAAPIVALSVIAAPPGYYTSVWLATACYSVVASWSVWLLLALRRNPSPGWLVATDVGVVAACIVALRFAVRPEMFSIVSNSDLEPVAIASAVSLGIAAPPGRAVAGYAVLAAAYWIAQAPAIEIQAGGAFPTVIDLGWQGGVVLVCGVIARRLRAVTDSVRVATEQVLAQRERLAEEQGRHAERRRLRREQQRRHLELHDGPLAMLTAMSRPPPVGHPDESVRRQCASNANLLRGLLTEDPDGPGSTLTDLHLGLSTAVAGCVALGLRVHCQFAHLPENLPPAVVKALTGASHAALNNVAAHAGTGTAWLTVAAEGPAERVAVTVDIVDQGVGFDPATTSWGLGLAGAIAGRMAAVGGTVTVDSGPDQGTWIRLRWQRA